MASQINPQPGPVTEVDFGQGDDGTWAPVSRAMPQAPGEATDDEDFARQAAAMGGYQKRPNRVWPVLAALIALGCFVGIAWLAYNWGLEAGFSHEVPVVRAEPGPIKAKPEDPGGLQVPNQDKLVLNQDAAGAAEPRVERLLSAPETPQPPVKPETSLAPGTSAAVAPEPAEAPQTAAAPAEPAAEAAPAATAPEPAAPANLEASTAPQLGKETPPATQSAEGPKIGGNGGGNGASSGNGAGSGSGAKTAAVAAAGGTQVAAVQKGDFVIQLASVTSSDAADKEWARLQKSFPELLGDMNLAVQEANVNGQLYHRVQTGPFPSRATAQDMCAQIKSKNQACIVQQR